MKKNYFKPESELLEIGLAVTLCASVQEVSATTESFEDVDFFIF